MQKLPITAVGYDESNNGHYPEICVAVFSDIPDHLRRIESRLPKRRRNHEHIDQRLQSVQGYSFLFFDYNDRKRLYHPRKGDTGYKKLGIIISSLLYGETFGDHLRVFVDGTHYNPREIDYLRGLLVEQTRIPSDCLELNFESQGDQHYVIVNIADETAHCILLDKPFRELRESGNRKELRLEEILEEERVKALRKAIGI